MIGMIMIKATFWYSVYDFLRLTIPMFGYKYRLLGSKKIIKILTPIYLFKNFFFFFFYKIDQFDINHNIKQRLNLMNTAKLVFSVDKEFVTKLLFVHAHSN